MFFELLPRNETINSSVHCRQLNESSNAIRKKRPELVNRKGVVFRLTPDAIYMIGGSSEIVAARMRRVTTSSSFT